MQAKVYIHNDQSAKLDLFRNYANVLMFFHTSVTEQVYGQTKCMAD